PAVPRGRAPRTRERGSVMARENSSYRLARQHDRDARATVAAATAARAQQAAARRQEARAAEAAGPRLTKADIDRAPHVRDRGGGHQAGRVNRASVTVRTVHSWDEKIPMEKVLEVRKP